MAVAAAIVFLLSFLVALAGIVLPLLPGVPVAAAGALLAAWMTGFERLGIVPLALVIGLAVLAQLVDVLGSYVGARYYGARRPGVWGGVLGSLAGLVFFPPFGFLLGALVGAVLLEMAFGRPLEEALRSGVGALVGTLGGVVAKVMLVVAIGVVVFPRLF